MTFSLVISNLLWHYWAQSGDVWQIVDAGRYVWHGALGYVYQGTSYSYALPLSFIVMAPISGLIDDLHLVEGAPYAFPHPSAWALVLPYTLLFGIFLLHAVRRLAWELEVRRGLLGVQVTACAVVLFPCYYWGHFEDALALAFVLYAVCRLLRSQYLAAGLMLSLAISSKQWAALILPLVIVLTPSGQRIRTLLAASAWPLFLATFVLGADWPDASRALFSPVNMGSNTPGHLSVYAAWLGAQTSRASRTLGLLVAPLLAWRFRKVAGPGHALMAIAVLLSIRPFSEAISYAYYWSPCLLVAGFVGLAAHKRFRWPDWAWQMGTIAWSMPRGNSATTAWWWAGLMVLLGATTVQMLRNARVAFGQRRSPLLSVKPAAIEPIPNPMTLAPTAGDSSWTR
jgi:hypothetical protein